MENKDGLDLNEYIDENIMLESTASKRKLVWAKTLTYQTTLAKTLDLYKPRLAKH